MKGRGFAWFSLLGAVALACGDGGDEGGGGKDAGPGQPDSGGGSADRPSGDPDGFTHDTNAEPDGGSPDQGGGGGDDAGMTLTEELEPGVYVQVAEARIHVGDGTGTSTEIDTFASVTAKLGNGVRTPAMNTRSYGWTLSNDVELTIWFANTNLDDDDQPPNEVDGTDEVLWIAVSGGFRGLTSRGIGLSSARSAVEMIAPAGYGPPPRTVAVTDPPGELAMYFTQGLLVAYDTNAQVRTITVSRAYNSDPGADIQVGDALLDFALGAIAGFKDFTPGTNRNQVINILGYPDGEGEANNLRVWSYAFIGIELFFLNAGNTVFFLTVHAPYYGTFDNSNVGLGSTRADVEAQLGLGMGTPSMANADFICYPQDTPEVIVSYTNGLASTITIGTLTCP